MSKHEVMQSLRNDFDSEILPYYNNCIRPKLRKQIQEKAAREKRTINLGWESKETKNKTTFHILKLGDKSGDTPYYISEFRWRGKHCYSTFFMDGIVVVYQKHCLDRYSERVLHKSIDARDIIYKYLLKKQDSAFTIVLPTPTHKHSRYLVMADALFLGDFEVPTCDADKNFGGIWFNTCISFEESRYTQEGIMQTLQFMQEYVKKLGYNPITNRSRFEREKRAILHNEESKKRLQLFLEKAYMMYMLHLSFDFAFTKQLFLDETKEIMGYIKETLQVDFSISAESLSPFAKEKGVALKGEIDFRG